MAKVKIELNRKGMRELLRSKEMVEAVRAEAEKVAQRAGTGYEADAQAGPHRAVARVTTATAAAYYENLKHNTLLKALGGGKT